MFKLLDERHKEYGRIKNEYPPMSPFVSGVERAGELKTMYGAIDQQVGIIFCKGLIEYYDKA